MPSGNRDDNSRLEAVLNMSIENHFNAIIESKTSSLVEEFLHDKDKLDKVAKKQVATLLKQKFKL